MICPNEANKDFDDLDCRECKWYMQCFKMWQDGNIWGKEEAMGDNFPKIKTEHPNLNKDGSPKTFKINFITKEEIDKFKIELEEIIYFSDLEKKWKI